MSLALCELTEEWRDTAVRDGVPQGDPAECPLDRVTHDRRLELAAPKPLGRDRAHTADPLSELAAGVLRKAVCAIRRWAREFADSDRPSTPLGTRERRRAIEITLGAIEGYLWLSGGPARAGVDLVASQLNTDRETLLDMVAESIGDDAFERLKRLARRAES